MAIEVKELVVRFTVTNDRNKTAAVARQYVDEEKIKSIVASMLEEFKEKLERKEER